MKSDRAAFIRANTVVGSPPLVPEIDLHLASEIAPIWQATEATLARTGLAPPYWAFCWPGGQALARYLLDNRETVRGRSVLDFASGCGIAAIAASKAGGKPVIANDIDPCAIAAIRLNAAINAVAVIISADDLVGAPNSGWDVVLAGDVCYERPMSNRITPWLRALAARGAKVLMGDPGRSYLPEHGVEEVARYDVVTSLELEDRTMRTTVVWRVLPS